MLDLLVANGTVVLPDRTLDADIGIVEGRIAEIGRLGNRRARKRVDAANQYVFPGMIDPHVHMCHPFQDTKSVDDFWSGTRSAAAGGNTTIIDFAIQWSGNPDDALAARMAEAEGEVIIDYALHSCFTKSDPVNIAYVPAIIEQGVTSFKVYMVYGKQGRRMDDGGLLAMLKATAEGGGVLNVHAENEAVAEYNASVLKSAGRTDPKYFPEYKPNLVEAEAVNRVLYLNMGINARLNIFHVSTKESLRLISDAQSMGQDVTAETCTHYLVLSKDRYKDVNGRNFICSPPLRSEDDVEAMWEGLSDGTLSVISSDHCGFSAEQKKDFGREFSDVPNGLPGVEERLGVVHEHGVVQRGMTVNRMVELLATNPAKLFGLYPKKGTVAVDADADLTIFDPGVRRKIATGALHSEVNWSPYEGMTVHGWPTKVIARGEVVMEDGRVTATPGRGRFLRRKP